jgi:hypothetical protein
MAATMKYPKFILGLAIPFLAATLFLKSCVISNPQPEECDVVAITVTEILEGSAFDIVFISSENDRYYINRGLEQGLSISALEEQVLNKKVTLHLPVLLFGSSKHIAQLAIADNVIFTEFD